MKKFIITIFAGILLTAGVSSEAANRHGYSHAHNQTHHHHHGHTSNVYSRYGYSSRYGYRGIGYPGYYTGYYGGYLYRWGWYPTSYYFNPMGYSYWPAYNYAPYYSKFGAIAYSKETGKFGYAFNHLSRSAAESSAISYCGANDCKSMVWVRGGCAAIAKSPSAEQIGWAYASSRNRAKSAALSGCRSGADDSCKLISWVCSGN